MISNLGLSNKRVKKFTKALEGMKPGNGRTLREEMEKKRTKVETKIRKILTDE